MPSKDNIDKAEAFKAEGNGYLTSGDPVRAIKPYTQAIALSANDHTLFSNRAFAFTKAEKYERALLDADRAIHLKPLWPKGHFRRGEAFRLSGLHARALEAYEAAAKCDRADEHLAKCVRDASESARRDQVFGQGIVCAGAAVGALLACMIFSSRAPGSTMSALVMLVLGAPLGMVARMCWEQKREWTVAAPSLLNNDFVASQFKDLKLPNSQGASKKTAGTEVAPPSSGEGAAGKKERPKTTCRESAINAARKRQAK